MHAASVPAIEILLVRREPLFVAFQNIAEFWNAATRPVSANGLGLTSDEVSGEIARMEVFFQIVNERSSSYALWKQLVIGNRVRGAQVHDARLAAVMITAGIAKILTFNVICTFKQAVW